METLAGVHEPQRPNATEAPASVPTGGVLHARLGVAGRASAITVTGQDCMVIVRCRSTGCSDCCSLDRGAMKLRGVFVAVVAVVAVVALGVPGSALADAFTAQLIVPVDGTTYSVSGPGRFAAEFQTNPQIPPGITQFIVEVNSEPTLGQDGTLANDLRKGFGVMYRRDSDPTKWAGSFTMFGGMPAGTYYFQYSGLNHQNFYDTFQSCATFPVGSDVLCIYASQIMSFTAVDAAATPAPTQPFYLRLSLQQAKTKAINFTRIRYGAKRQIVACKRVIDPTSTMRSTSGTASSGMRCARS